MAFDLGGSAIVGSLDLDISKLTSKADQAAASVEKLDGAGENAFSGAEKSATSFGDKLDAIGGKMMKVGGMMTLAFTAPIVAGFKSMFGGAADLEQSIGATEQIFGDSAAAIIDWSETANDAFGMTQDQALTSVNNFNAMFKQLDAGTDVVADMSQGMVGLSADLSAMWGGSSQEAANSMLSALRGNYEGLDKYNINLTEAMVSQEAMNVALADGRDEITEADKLTARYNLILEQTTDAQGQFGRETDTASGQLAIMRANLGDAAAGFGKLLLPAGTKAAKMLTDLVKRIDGMNDTQKKWVLGIAAVVAGIGPLMTGLGFLVSNITTLGAVIGFLLSPIGLVVVALGVLTYLFRDEITGAISGVIGFIGDLIEGWQMLGDDMSVVERMLRAISFALAMIGGEDTPEWIAALARSFGRLAEAFSEGGFSALLGQVVDEFVRLGDWIRDAVANIDWSAVGQSLLNGLLSLVGWVAGFVLPLGLLAVSVAGWLVGAIPDVWAWLRDTAIPAIGDGLVSLPGVLVNVVAWAVGSLPNIWSWLQGMVIGGTYGDGTGGPTAGKVGGIDLASVIVNVLGWAQGAIPDVAQDILGWIGNVTVSIADGYWNLVVGEPNVESDLESLVMMAIEGVVGRTVYYSLKLAIQVTDYVVENPEEAAAGTLAAIAAIFTVKGALKAVPVSFRIHPVVGGIVAGVLFAPLVFQGIKGYFENNPLKAVEVLTPIQAVLQAPIKGLDDAKTAIENQLVIWGDGISLPDVNISAPTISLPALNEWPGYPEAVAIIEEFRQMITDPLGWIMEQTGDAPDPTGPNGESPVAAPEATPGTQKPPMEDNKPLPGGFSGADNRLAQVFRDIATAAGQAASAIPPVTLALDGVGATTPVIGAVGLTAQASFGLAGSSAGQMAAIILPTFSSIAGSAGVNFGSMAATVLSTTASAASTAGANFGAIAGSAITNFSSMRSTGSAQSAGLQASVVSAFATMSAQAGSSLGQMAGNALTRFSSMRSNASSAGSQIASAISSGTAQAANAAGSNLGRLAGIVVSAGAAAAANARSAGVSIGEGLATGIDAMYLRVAAAGARLANAASEAIALAAQVKSPSRVTMRLGEYLGEGFELGILSMVRDAHRAAAALVNVPGFTGNAYRTTIPAAVYGTPAAGATAYADHRSYRFDIRAHDTDGVVREIATLLNMSHDDVVGSGVGA